MKKALIVVSFGTTYEEQRMKSLGAIEQALKEAYPNRDCFVAYTSSRIRSVYKTERDIHISGVREQLKECLEEGYEDILMVVTHMMWGHEYEKVIREVCEAQDAYLEKGHISADIRISRPLSTTEDDRKILAQGLIEDFQHYMNEYDGLIFMGHGSSHDNTVIYEEIQGYLTDKNNGVWLRTVEGDLTLEPRDLVEQTQKKNPHYLLAPFMIVAGDHATNDLAGDDEDSWKSQLEAIGCTVNAHLVGLGERPWLWERLVQLGKQAMTLDEIRR